MGGKICNYQPCKMPWEALSSRMMINTVNKITRVDTILSILYLRSGKAFSPKRKTLGQQRSSLADQSDEFPSTRLSFTNPFGRGRFAWNMV